MRRHLLPFEERLLFALWAAVDRCDRWKTVLKSILIHRRMDGVKYEVEKEGFVSAMFNKPFFFVSEFIGQIVRGFAPVPDAILR